MKFAKHGTLDATVEDSILIIEGVGPWNIEMLEAADKKAREAVKQLYKGKWGVLSIMHGEAAFLPDAASRLTEWVKAEKTKGRCATAIIVCDSTSPHFSKGHLGQIYTRAGETVAFFDHKQQAMDWLKQQLQ